MSGGLWNMSIYTRRIFFFNTFFYVFNYFHLSTNFFSENKNRTKQSFLGDSQFSLVCPHLHDILHVPEVSPVGHDDVGADVVDGPALDKLRLLLRPARQSTNQTVDLHCFTMLANQSIYNIFISYPVRLKILAVISESMRFF